MSPRERMRSRAPMGVLVVAGSDGVGASVAASLLALEAQAEGARVLIVGPSLRAQRIAALFGVLLPTTDAPPVRIDRDIHVCGSMPRISGADVVLCVPASRAQSMLDAVDVLAAHTTPATALVLADRGAGALAASFAALKLILGRRPQLHAAVTPCGDADVSALHHAVERWLGRSLLAAPALPIDPTLPVALGAGIPLADAVHETALTLAAGALWSALSTSAPLGATA